MYDECPKCGGDIYVNTARIKEEGWKGPQFKCKDRDDCDWTDWGINDKKKGQKKGGTAQAKGPRWTWPMLSMYYRNSLAIAVKHVKKAIPDAQPEDILAGAHTVLIAATKGGVADAKPKQEPKPYDNVPLEDEEVDDLPF